MFSRRWKKLQPWLLKAGIKPVLRKSVILSQNVVIKWLHEDSSDAQLWDDILIRLDAWYMQCLATSDNMHLSATAYRCDCRGDQYPNHARGCNHWYS